VVDLGDNRVLDSTSCTSLAGDDLRLDLAHTDLKAEVRRLALVMNGPKALQSGHYALMVCDTLVDYVGQGLDGDGNDTDGGLFTRTFEVARSNRLDNPNFDYDSNHWQITSGSAADIYWQPADVRGDLTSGSLLMVNQSGGPEAVLSVSQCVSVTGGEGYFLGGRIRVDNNDGGTLLAVSQIDFFAGGQAGCDQVALDDSVTREITSDTADQWSETAGAGRVPDDARWARVTYAVTVGPEAGQDWVGVEIDDLFFATVPDSPQVDGFETGDTSRWN
jgi:hypothetical protein